MIETYNMAKWWNKNWRWVFWITLPVCMIIGAIWFNVYNFTEENLITGLFKVGPLLWLIFWLLIVLVWMLLHMDDGNNSGTTSGGLNIPAPSKQTQRMLKRNMRRRWFK